MHKWGEEVSAWMVVEEESQEEFMMKGSETCYDALFREGLNWQEGKKAELEAADLEIKIFIGSDWTGLILSAMEKLLRSSGLESKSER